MSTILTAFSPVDHPRELLKALRSDENTVHFHCSDGEFSSSVLLLAAVSPLIQEIGRQNSSCGFEEFNLLLPDHSVTEIQQFMTFLTSYSGPCTSIERQTFAQLLRFFGQHSIADSRDETTGVTGTTEVAPKFLDTLTLFQPDEADSAQHRRGRTKKFPMDTSLDLQQEEIIKDEKNVPEEQSTDSEIEEEDWNPDYQSSDFEEADMAPTKGPTFKKTGKFSEEVLRSYDDSRRIFVCRICGTERKRSDRLALHLQWHEDHPGESYQTRNNCKICGRFNATYFMLKMHMTRMHTDMPKTFQCLQDGCGKAFRFKGELKIHGMTHSKERNFVCSECGERFRSKGQMELHATRRHNPDTRPSIPCEECGKLFRIQADLRNHLSRTHRARLERQHRCNDCDLTFRSEKSLISHMTLHDPGRPLQCSRCSLRYKNKDALVAHEKTHDNAQYACEFCSIAFKRKDNLKRHIKSKHSTMSIIDKLMLNTTETTTINNHQLLIPHQKSETLAGYQ